MTTRDWPERDRLKAANTPQPWTTNPSKVTREDLFNAIDILSRQLIEHDHTLDPAIRARLTEIRSLAATLIPKRYELACGFKYSDHWQCQVRFASESARAEHREHVHGITPHGNQTTHEHP